MWGMKILALTLLLSITTVFATPSYQLINFSSTRVRNIAEILTETKLSIDQLSLANCDDLIRKILFTKSIVQNEAKDSLRIVDSKRESFVYHGNGVVSPIQRRQDRFLKKAIKALQRLEGVAETNQLIEELQSAPKPFYIKKGSNRYMPHNEGERPYTHENEAGLISILGDLRPIVETIIIPTPCINWL
jgi:hypothetical protein